MQRLAFVLGFLAMLGSGLVAGTFFAFSTFVMPALARLPPGRGLAAMQAINARVTRSVFLVAFVGTALLCVLVAALSLGEAGGSAARRIGACATYLGGVIVVTRATHIPRNDALAATRDLDGAAWTTYVREWTRWNHVRAAAALAATALLALPGCSTFRGYATCDEPAARLATAPRLLSETGLYTDIGSRTVASTVVAYRPRFELWSDGAPKSRYLALPPGSRIDTTDPDAWQFPKGTKLWKAIGPVETRYMEKVGDGPDDWSMMAYVWNGSDAVATPEGNEAAGIPAARQCLGCHGGTPGHVLGYSAVQLSDRPLPGDATAQAALGYLHANCSHCHNQHRPARAGARCFDPQTGFDLSLRVGELGSVTATATYRTAVGTVIDPGHPGRSDLVGRFEGRVPFAPRMPALGTKATNPEAAALLARWIEQMPLAPRERP